MQDAVDSGGAKKGFRLVSQHILPLVILLLSGTCIFYSYFTFGFWNPVRGGTSGFLPVIVSTVLFIAGLVAFVQAPKTERPSYHSGSFLVVLLAGGIVLASYVIGMLPALLLFVFLWLKVYEKYPWKIVILVMAVLSAFGFGVFVYWLNVPFPKGMLFQ